MARPPPPASSCPLFDAANLLYLDISPVDLFHIDGMCLTNYYICTTFCRWLLTILFIAETKNPPHQKRDAADGTSSRGQRKRVPRCGKETQSQGLLTALTTSSVADCTFLRSESWESPRNQELSNWSHDTLQRYLSTRDHDSHPNDCLSQTRNRL
mmetsp:Transcript_47862/g.72372  ORF Transcript_47862/g.72372 Transcript_47862/m.72372 type:complete len:155 (+) Transcript_47862:375-839(+)